jgi:hypothetical protein
MDTHVATGRTLGVVVLPELGRLLGHVPNVGARARREVPLLRTAAFLVGPRPHDHSGVGLGVWVDLVGAGGVIEAVAPARAAQRIGERLRLQSAAAREPIHGALGKGSPSSQRLLVLPVDEREPPLGHEPIAIGDHLGDLVRRVDVHERERHMTAERLPRQPQHDRAVLADRPEHAELCEVGIRLAQEVHAAMLEGVEVSHGVTALPAPSARGRRR